MKSKKLLKHGWQGRLLQLAKQVGDQLHHARPELNERERLGLLDAVKANPALFLDDEMFKKLAEAVMREKNAAGLDGSVSGELKPGDAHGDTPGFTADLMPEAIPYRVWGKEDIEGAALEQMDVAAHLPVARLGALMPDAHVGYGLPIGGVLGLVNAVCPYGVGVDIACRMRLSLMEMPEGGAFESDWRFPLRNALISETLFGIGAEFQDPNDHAVMDDPAWGEIPWVRDKLKDRAWRQLGTSGTGNHFVEFGEIELQDGSDLGIPEGRYLALMSHSGSRNLGAQICNHYSRIAKQTCQLPAAARQLAFMMLDSEAGQEYWIAMNLAGRYAAANHEIIHKRVLGALGFAPLAHVENHHNFAWKETHGGEEIIVHRKGATPAGPDVLGIIPGSMADPGFLVRGLGNASSLMSASHGAGRKMGRKEAKRRLSHAERDAYLNERGVELIGGGLDESPQAYKPIQTVMSSQRDLVRAIGEFRPRIVLMAKD